MEPSSSNSKVIPIKDLARSHMLIEILSTHRNLNTKDFKTFFTNHKSILSKLQIDKLAILFLHLNEYSPVGMFSLSFNDKFDHLLKNPTPDNIKKLGQLIIQNHKSIFPELYKNETLTDTEKEKMTQIIKREYTSVLNTISKGETIEPPYKSHFFISCPIVSGRPIYSNSDRNKTYHEVILSDICTKSDEIYSDEDEIREGSVNIKQDNENSFITINSTLSPTVFTDIVVENNLKHGETVLNKDSMNSKKKKLEIWVKLYQYYRSNLDKNQVPRPKRANIFENSEIPESQILQISPKLDQMRRKALKREGWELHGRFINLDKNLDILPTVPEIISKPTATAPDYPIDSRYDLDLPPTYSEIDL